MHWSNWGLLQQPLCSSHKFGDWWYTTVHMNTSCVCKNVHSPWQTLFFTPQFRVVCTMVELVLIGQRKKRQIGHRLKAVSVEKIRTARFLSLITFFFQFNNKNLSPNIEFCLLSSPFSFFSFSQLLETVCFPPNSHTLFYSVEKYCSHLKHHEIQTNQIQWWWYWRGEAGIAGINMLLPPFIQFPFLATPFFSYFATYMGIWCLCLSIN